MKTIDEAMELLISPVKSKADGIAKLESMKESLDRRQDLLDDIARNPIVLEYVQQYMNESGPVLNWSIASLALSLFINGIMIGMEMERQEFSEAAK